MVLSLLLNLLEKNPKETESLWTDCTITSGHWIPFIFNISILTKRLHREGTMPMDDHILTNHISIVASHFNTIFDESIKKILPSDTKKETASKIPGQKGGRKEKPWNFPCWYSSPASPTYSTCRGLIKLPGHIQKQEQVKTKAFRLLSGLKAPAYLAKVLFFRKPVRVQIQIQVHTYKLKKIHVTCLSFKYNTKHECAAWQTHAKEPCFSRFLVMFQLLPSLNILKKLHTMPKNQLSSQSSQCDVNSQVSQNPPQRVSLRWGRTSARETSTLPANDIVVYIVVSVLWWSAPKTWILPHPTLNTSLLDQGAGLQLIWKYRSFFFSFPTRSTDSWQQLCIPHRSTIQTTN